MKIKYDTNLLELWLKNKGVKLEKEYKFHPKRKWLVDYAILEWKLIIEVEGLFSKNKKGENVNSRHRSISGFIKDIAKYNAATILGWSLFRVDSKTFRDTQALNILQMWYEMNTEGKHNDNTSQPRD